MTGRCEVQLVPGGWADARRAASIVQFLPVGLPLPSPPFILNGRFVVWDDGDDVLLEVGWQVEGHGVNLVGKQQEIRDWAPKRAFWLQMQRHVFTYLRFLVWCVSFRVAENETNIFGELHRVFIIPFIQCFWHCSQVHWRVNDVPVVLMSTTEMYTHAFL